MALTTGIYAQLPVLVDRSSGTSVAAWPVRYVRMLDMANDSQCFRTQEELQSQESAWSIIHNRFQSKSDIWMPLLEGKMIQAFDHRAADITTNEVNVFRPGQQTSLTAEEHANPERLALPRYWVPKSRVAWEAPTEWAIAFKDVTAATNARTVIAALIPAYGAGRTLPVSKADWAKTQPLLLGNFNALVFDYLARQKIHTNHLTWYSVEQLPVLPVSAYTRLFGAKAAAEIVREAVLELSYTAHDLAPFARDMGYVDPPGEVLPPFVWDEDRRLRLRAKLDALYFILYGVFDPANPAQGRDDIRYIYSTFPIVEREEIARWGSYRSRDLCLAWVNALAAGQPDAEIA
jgi:hypothetical protein